MIFLLLIFIPLLICSGFFIFGGHKITPKEVLIQLGIQLLITVISCSILLYGNLYDNQILSGRVSGKEKVRVSCEHSYRCYCHEVCTGSGEDRSCHEVCSTCYEHSHDFDWRVYTNIRYTFEIDRINRQGTQEPPRWSKVNIGDPIVVSSSYINYIKGASDSLFRYQNIKEKYKDILPKYPDNIYDYYNLNRVISIKSNIDTNKLNKELTEINSDLGHSKQVNAILVISTNINEEFYYALKQHWIGGKKNDAIIMIDIDANYNINWVNVIALTKNNIFQIKMRDDIKDLKNINDPKFFNIIRNNINLYYDRKSMSEFEYLRKNIQISTFHLTCHIIFGIICSIALSIFFYNENLE